MEGEEGMLSPSPWLQTTNTLTRANRRRSYSVLLNSSALIIVFIVAVLSLIFIVIPALHSFISHMFKPQLVKKGWDLLNVALVLFAIVCVFLGRNYDESTNSCINPSTPNQPHETTRSNDSCPSTPHSWCEYSDRIAYNRINTLTSSSSIPDLCQVSPWNCNDEGWRCYEDAHVSSFRTVGPNQHQHLYQRQHMEEGTEELGDENIAAPASIANTEASSNVPPQPPSSPPPPSSSPPLPSPLPTSQSPPSSTPPTTKVSRRKNKRVYLAIGKFQETNVQQSNYWEVKNLQPPPPPQLLPPSPPQESALLFDHGNEIAGQNSKRGTATKDFLTTLRRRRKKQRQRSMENFEAFPQSSAPAVGTFQKQGPPPPPPPPSVFRNFLIKNKVKQKKLQPFPQTILPPPESRKLTTRKPKAKSYGEANAVHIPSIPMRISGVTRIEKSANKGNESPLITIPPPPPPPPPYKVRKWKFAVQGDSLRINSTDSSRSNSPDLDGGDESPSIGKIQLNDVSAVQGKDSTLFCSSPDVDLKANRFIASFRAGLKQEKINSMKEKQSRRKSNLGQRQIQRPETKAMRPKLEPSDLED